MTIARWPLRAAAAFMLSLTACAALAADYPAPKQGVWVAKDFRFHDGQTLPEVKLGYVTIGDPAGEPVLIIHGTAGSAAGLLTPAFAGELFGPGQALDATKYFIVIPDSLGVGASSKPSDGLKAKFPQYNYDDAVSAQYRLVGEGLGIRHLRLVLGNSMGGMQTWVWGVAHPDFMDALVPMASQPTAMSSRNWMMRRMLIECDPQRSGVAGRQLYHPAARFRCGSPTCYFGIATNGGTLAYQKRWRRHGRRPTGWWMNDWQHRSPRMPTISSISGMLPATTTRAPGASAAHQPQPVLAINSADDERNPPETGIMERELKRLASAKLLLIPASEDTRGHGTTGLAKFWAKDLAAWLPTIPKRAATGN